MNWVLIAVLLILAVSAAVGYRKGILRIVYSIVSWVIVLAFVSCATPHINLYLLENTSMYEKITEKCEETIRRTVNERIAQAEQEKSDELTAQLEENTVLADLGIFVPDTVVEQILGKVSGAAGEVLEDNGAYTAIAAGLAEFAVEGIAFLIALVAAWVLVHFASQLMGSVSKIPVVKGVNRSLGMFVGAAYGLLLVWLMFYIIALGSTSDSGRIMVSYIYDSPLLIYLYENNPILTVVLRYFK